MLPDALLKDIEATYRRLAKSRHPDRGGSKAIMAELNAAFDEGKRVVR